MATRDIYESGFDEDVPANTNNACPDCGGYVRTNTAETVCDDCGLVLSEYQIDHGPEWRLFSADDEAQKRTGAPLTPTRHDRGLSSEIGYKRDATGRTLSGKKQQQVARMRREQSRGRFQSKAEANLAHGLGEVRRIAGALELSESTRDQACRLFRSAQSEDLLRGRSIEAIAAGCVYGACRCNAVLRTLPDVAGLARVERSRVTNAYKTLNTELRLPIQPIRPSEFVPQLASELEIPENVRRRARDLATNAEVAGLTTGLNPSGFAGACLYKASRDADLHLTQSEASQAANVSVATIRSHRDTLNEFDSLATTATESSCLEQPSG
ncbi:MULTISPECIES: transcription initiation factor IIB family protein [unclassified Haloferax]|uniref:transcription initiation factor IIB n=1 Tax=unclassified Haloferax TaxID=2625095 RepID=UPI0028759D35|nr:MULTISPECIES: transcription initiation factor IIB family protein [unclassified Haloferax]MDS0243761.1 transcription initiation factor IIB family protein [Haloferax sp. S2CR25]MDS0446882.1 transcription initiation factor IIB family protein [Haloferax sp. S2CR25-2]